jgi:hypothetical protein
MLTLRETLFMYVSPDSSRSTLMKTTPHSTLSIMDLNIGGLIAVS